MATNADKEKAKEAKMKKAAEAKAKKEQAKIKKAEVAKVREEKEAKEGPGARTLLMIAIPVVLVILVFYFLILPSLSVPFSTFKSNFNSAPRVAFFAVYANQSESGAVLQCATQAIEVTAQSRNASTIDFYVLNQTSCTYPVGGLGHAVTLATNTISNCISMAGSEPSVYLNVTSSNRTFITAHRFYVYGNYQYMSQCPISVDLS